MKTTNSSICDSVLHKDKNLFSRNYLLIRDYFSNINETEFNSLKERFEHGGEVTDYLSGIGFSSSMSFDSAREHFRNKVTTVTESTFLSDNEYRYTEVTSTAAIYAWSKCMKDFYQNSNQNLWANWIKTDKSTFTIRCSYRPVGNPGPIEIYFDMTDVNASLSSYTSTRDSQPTSTSIVDSEGVEPLSFSLEVGEAKDFVFSRLNPNIDSHVKIRCRTLPYLGWQYDQLIDRIPRNVMMHGSEVLNYTVIPEGVIIANLRLNKSEILPGRNYKIIFSFAGHLNINVPANEVDSRTVTWLGNCRIGLRINGAPATNIYESQLLQRYGDANLSFPGVITIEFQLDRNFQTDILDINLVLAGTTGYFQPNPGMIQIGPPQLCIAAGSAVALVEYH